MREILFRAKTEPNCKDVITGKIIKNPKWVYGYVDLGYMHDCKSSLIGDEKGNKTYKCQYETIGQFTGLTDKSGKKIFEGDIGKYKQVDGAKRNGKPITCIGKVVYNVKTASFAIESKDKTGCKYFDYFPIKDFEVIGNIHDNPELLELPKGE